MTFRPRVHIKLSLYIIGLLFICTSNSVHAQSIKTLNEDNITDFITETTEMTNGSNLSFDADEIQAYLRKHIHKKARFKSKIDYNIPGFPTRSTSLSLNKKEFMESVGKGSDSLADYENEIEILDIKISKDKTKATVRTTGTETGTMPVEAPDASMQHVPIEGETSCTQILTLKKNVIQMYNANCTTSVSFTDF